MTAAEMACACWPQRMLMAVDAVVLALGVIAGWLARRLW